MLSQTGSPKTRVKLDVVSKNDTLLQSQINSYVNRELRTLGDVEIVYDNQQYTLSIIAFVIEGTYGTPIGVAMATTITEPIVTDLFKSVLKSDADKRTVELVFSVYETHINSFLNVGPPGQVQAICKDIVVMFDSSILEMQRKFQQRLGEVRRLAPNDN
ncbi:MAG: hypothetical protein HY238_26165 [Acidobacteria bacterium]|nr:hypothetical protein [Acidobacteriota bacterium]